jgi:hypothetical protein
VIYKIKKPSLLITIVIAAIIGFIGTGINFNIKYYTDTKNVRQSYEQLGFSFDLNLGWGTINNFLYKNTVVLSKKDSSEITIKNLQFIEKLVQSYNDDAEFITNNFYRPKGASKSLLKENIKALKSEYGKIIDYKFIGYNELIIPKDKTINYYMFFKSNLDKPSEYGSIQITIQNTNGKSFISEIFFYRKDVTYKVLNEN